jgi:SAM-dependent methyltransferase
LSSSPGDYILDLGCGTGWLSVILAKRGFSVKGVDISPVAIEIANQRARANNVEDKVDFEVMSFYDLKFSDNEFDKIISLNAFHHAEDRKLFAHNIFKVLKKGGLAILCEPFGNSTFLEKLRLLIPVKINDEDKSHWNDQIKYKDLDVFRPYFLIDWKEFHFFSRLDRVFKNKKFIKFLNYFDRSLLKNFPFIRPYARSIVIKLVKL